MFSISRSNHPNTNSREKAENDVINIFASEDMENMLLRSRMQIHMNFTSGVFSSKTPVSI